jgi:serine/threonine-protein kinase
VSCVEQTRPGVVKGKFAYMSPEQTIGQRLDGRSDVFSLAILLWELLAGKIMVPRSDPIEGMRMIRDCRFPPIEKERPDLPANLSGALGRALQNKREDRSTAVDLGRALEEYIKNSSDGIGSSLELAQWIRERFPRENLSEMQKALRDEPAGTRPATGATRAAPPESATNGEEEDENSPTVDSPLRAPPAAAITASGSTPIPSEMPALRAASPPAGFARRHPTTGESTSAHVMALPREDYPTVWGSPNARQHAGVVMEALDGVQSSSVIVADDWAIDERTAPPGGSLSMDDTLDGELNDMTVEQGDRTENDLTRILSGGTGSAHAQPASGHTGALTRPGRRRGIALLIAAGAAAGVFGAVVLSSDGSDARSEPDGEEAVEVTGGPAPVVAVATPNPTATTTSGEAPAAEQPQLETPPPVAGDATLDVVTRPEGAKVVLGDLDPLVSPAHFDKVPPGRYDVRVELKGHTTLARSVELAAGEHRSLELDLDPVARPPEPPVAPVARDDDKKKNTREKEKAIEKRVPPPAKDGTVKIRTRPYSEVYLGSRRLGQTPLIKELKPGKYVLVFKHPGKPNVKKTVTIKPGEATKLDFALE